MVRALWKRRKNKCLSFENSEQRIRGICYLCGMEEEVHVYIIKLQFLLEKHPEWNSSNKEDMDEFLDLLERDTIVLEKDTN
jgi:hypothetical protein